jgi:ribosomal protein L24E
MKCLYCGEELIWDRGKGWVHQDGEIYKQRKMTKEEMERFIQIHNRPPDDFEMMVDDHCVMPIK